MSKAIETMQLLTESGMGGLSWPLMGWLAKLPKESQMLPSTSIYKVAFDLYDERYPNATNKTIWEKLRGGYRIAYSNFEAEFKQKIELLMTDKDNRIAFVKRRIDELYMGEMKFQSLMKWGDYVLTKEFKELKSKIDTEFWDELELSGAAAHQSATYGVAISNMLERALQLDGVPLNENNRLWKEPSSDEEDQINQEKTNFEEVLDVIDRKVSDHFLNTDGFLRKANPARYAPMNQFWNDLSDEDRIIAIERYSGWITEYLGEARKLADIWYEEKQQYVLLQPERAEEITIEHRDYYVNKIKETYLPVQSWYSDYYKDGHLDAKGLERKIFFFCYDTERPFENGLYLFANIYGCYLVVELFNNELNKLNKESIYNNRAEVKTEIRSFTDLFFDTKELQKAVEVLHKTTAANKFKVIDSNGCWIGQGRDGSRSVLLAWIEVLRLQGWFKLVIPNNKMSELLNGYFIGLKLSTTDDSLWRHQKKSTITNSYHADFLQHIKKR